MTTLTKSEIIRHLWAVLEKTPKALRELAENPAARGVRSAGFGAIRSALDGLDAVEDVEAGTFYTYKGYEADEIALVRTEGFRIGDDDKVAVAARVVYAAAKRVRYKDMADTIFLSDTSNLDPAEVNPKDLTAYVGSAFVGTLLGELISGAKD